MSFVKSLGSKTTFNVDVQILKAPGDTMSILTEFSRWALNCFVVFELKHEPTHAQLGELI